MIQWGRPRWTERLRVEPKTPSLTGEKVRKLVAVQSRLLHSEIARQCPIEVWISVGQIWSCRAYREIDKLFGRN